MLARLVKSTSKLEAEWLIDESGIAAPYHDVIFHHLRKAQDQDYLARLTTASRAHDAGYLLEDVETPQVLLGLLVDDNGIPLEINSFEEPKAQASRLMPVIEKFRQHYDQAEIIVVADAATLPTQELNTLDRAGFGVLLGSRVTRAPANLEDHFSWSGSSLTDGQLIDTAAPRPSHEMSMPTTTSRSVTSDSWGAV